MVDDKLKKDVVEEEESPNLNKMIAIDLNAYNILDDLKKEFKTEQQRHFTFSDVIRELVLIKNSKVLKGGRS